ncbi:Rrf2 family transcriptional regulator [Devosia limi DSM 17137]|uniref:Rrf2 family transcriptional regulator n=1 Tax=Devosia limi DSM 17137 TaxID=1121477 RepID=A0A0F5L1R2_9HYPH|nr:Rrf2 family transcriptional regulator [Devosia limi]KKB76361.1 Rrf2 family transcriptional regulator [Devosia limi DSM 17137]SHF71966.1 transcriptional regulator, BadM/Rrf2 family [Devosia limi DSM 17137]
MKLGEGVEQAIHSTLLLAGLDRDGVLPATALAEFHGVSASYLLKHLQALTNAGILASVPGPKGGYRLARAPAAISLLDIVLALEGSAPAFRCAEIRKQGPNPLDSQFFARPCAVNVAMLRAEQSYRAELRKVSLADLRTDPATPLGAAIEARGCAFLEQRQRRSTSTP